MQVEESHNVAEPMETPETESLPNGKSNSLLNLLATSRIIIYLFIKHLASKLLQGISWMSSIPQISFLQIRKSQIQFHSLSLMQPMIKMKRVMKKVNPKRTVPDWQMLLRPRFKMYQIQIQIITSMDETMIVQRLEKVQNKSLFFRNVHKTHKTYFLPWFLSCSLLQTLQKKTFFRFKAKKSCFSNFYWLDMFNCLVTTADTMCDKLENNFVSKLTLKERHNSRKNPQLCAQW